MRGAIAIAGAVPYPKGGAPTSRIRSLAHGLAEAGADVHVIASGKASVGAGAAGTSSRQGNVHFWPLPEPEQGRRRGMVEQHASFVVGATRRLRLLRRDHDVRTLVLYNQQSTITFPLLVAARSMGMAVVQQYAEQQVRDDFHGAARHLHYANQRATFLYAPARTDGCLVISHALERLCRERGASEVLVVPALASTEPAQVSAPVPYRWGERFVLTYVGLGLRRDCLEQIVHIAARLRALGLPLHLQMLGLGEAAKRDVQRWGLAAACGDHIEVCGWLTREELDARMNASHAFIFLREDDLSGRSAFPTRLPELMLTRRPVLCSRVGDISCYLEDGRDLLFVRGADVDGISERLAALARTAGALEALGDAGAAAATRAFDYRMWGERTAEFLARIEPNA